MSEELTQGTEQVAEGQSSEAPEPASQEGTQEAANGQPEDGTSEASQNAPADDIIFDPAEYQRLTEALPDDLKGQAEALRKSLQGAFTKKTQSIADSRKKIEAYDAFTANPEAALKQFAQQYGYELKKPNQGDQQQEWNPDSGDPKSWQDVTGYILSKMRQEFGGQLEPIVSEFSSMRKQSIESQLSEIDAGWHQYEDKMMANLEEHPTLSKDPALLYRMSVPPEVAEARATQAALRKMEAKTQAAQVQSPSSTTKQPISGLPDKPVSFQDAVAAARKKIAEDGMTAP